MMISVVRRQCRTFILLMVCLCTLVSPAIADPVTDYNVAVEFYKQQRWDLAADACEDFFKKNPGDERGLTIRLYWAQSLLHLRKFKDAREQFRTFLQQAGDHPDRPLAMYRVGECSYFMTDFAGAETDLQLFLKTFPQHDLAEWAWVYLGESQLRMKKYEQAVQAFEAYIARAPQGRLLDDSEFGLATALDALKQSDKANAVYERILQRPNSPRAADALFNLAARDFDDQKFAEAATRFQRVATQYPQSRLVPSAHLNAGYSLYYLANYAEARDEFRKAAADPVHRQVASYWLGLSEKSLGDYPAAAKTFSSTLKDAPDGPLAEKLMFQWGDAEFRQQNYAKAVELFTQVSQKWPNGELADDGLHSACEAALQAGNIDQALQLNAEFTKRFPDSGLMQVQELLSGRILITQGSQLGVENPAGKSAFERASTVLKHVAETSTVETTKAIARFQLARVAERLGQDTEVLEQLKPILDAPNARELPEYSDALLMRANVRLRLKDGQNALKDYNDYLATAKTETDKVAGLAGKASSLILLQNWDMLDPVLDELDAADPKNTRLGAIALAAGDAAFDQKSWDVAKKFFNRVLERGQDNPYALPALSGLAHVEYEQKEYVSAAASFGKLAESGAGDPALASHSMYMQALSLQQGQQAKEALAIYQNAAQKFSQTALSAPLSSDHAEVSRNAYRSQKGGARVARELQDIPAADALYQQAHRELKMLPTAERAELDLLIYEWADLSYNAQNYQRSDELFALLIQDCPNSPLVDDARLILAESLRFSGKKEEATKAFQQLVDDAKSDEFVLQRSLTHLLDLAADARNWEQVVAVGQRISSQFPNSEHEHYAKYRIGEGELQLKQYPQAERTLQLVCDELSKDLSKAPAWWPEAWLLLAESQFWQKNYGKMNESLQQLRQKAPDSPLLYRADAIEGRALENQARFPEARQAYQRVIDSEAGRGTETAAEAQFRVAESYLKEQNLPVALREYYKVYSGYDAPKYESAALFQAGACDESLKRLPEAAMTYKKLISEFPDSEFASKARERLKAIEPMPSPASDQPTS